MIICLPRGRLNPYLVNPFVEIILNWPIVSLPSVPFISFSPFLPNISRLCSVHFPHTQVSANFHHNPTRTAVVFSAENRFYGQPGGRGTTWGGMEWGEGLFQEMVGGIQLRQLQVAIWSNMNGVMMRMDDIISSQPHTGRPSKSVDRHSRQSCFIDEKLCSS